MTITKNQQGTDLTIALEGRLDTVSTRSLEAELKSCLEGITALRFDFNQLEYISSAGLRVLLSAQKVMNQQGSMAIFGTNEEIDEVFEMTGFCDILTVEK